MTRVHGPIVSCGTGVAQDEELSPPPWLLHPVEARRSLAVTLPTPVTRLGCAGPGRRRSRRLTNALRSAVKTLVKQSRRLARYAAQ
jgi:hypothetical protein